MCAISVGKGDCAKSAIGKCAVLYSTGSSIGSRSHRYNNSSYIAYCVCHVKVSYISVTCFEGINLFHSTPPLLLHIEQHFFGYTLFCQVLRASPLDAFRTRVSSCHLSTRRPFINKTSIFRRSTGQIFCKYAFLLLDNDVIHRV